jgi:DNA-binding transcriptional LysR family regulator
LLEILGPAIRDLREELGKLQDARETVAGVVRLTMIPIAFESIIRPMLPSFCQLYPDVTVEISTNEGLNDIVADAFDGGIRFGTLIDKDMIGVALTKSTPVVIAGSASYFKRYPIPAVPEDLAAHRSISYRYMSSSRLFRWPLVKGGRKFTYTGNPSLIFDDGAAIRSAVIDGIGLGFLLRSQVAADLEAGILTEVLTDWLADLPGFSLYYPSRHRTSSAFRAFIEHLRNVSKSSQSRT